MTNGYDYNTYIAWVSFVPLGVLIAGFVFSVISLIPFMCMVKNCQDYFTRFLFIYAKVVFRSAIQKKDDSNRIYLHSYEVSQLHLVLFSTPTTFIFCMVFVTFWVSFLIEETSMCNTELDCFFTNSSDELPSQRIDDCADLADVNGTVTVTCYEFVLAVTEGFSKALGFLAVVAAYIVVNRYLLVWLLEGVYSDGHSNCVKRWFCCGIMSLLVLPLFGGMVVLVIVSTIPFFIDILTENMMTLILFVTYFVFFVYIGPTTNFWIYHNIVKHGVKMKTIEMQKADNSE